MSTKGYNPWCVNKYDFDMRSGLDEYECVLYRKIIYYLGPNVFEFNVSIIKNTHAVRWKLQSDDHRLTSKENYHLPNSRQQK